MRSNRMLYLPGVKPDDIAAIGTAKLVPFTSIPQPAPYGLVAVFHVSLAERATFLGQTPERENDKLQGGWYLLSGISYPSGRFGFLQEFDHHPGDVNLHLPLWRDQHLFREDYFVTKALLQVPDKQITLCDGPYLWR